MNLLASIMPKINLRTKFTLPISCTRRAALALGLAFGLTALPHLRAHAAPPGASDRLEPQAAALLQKRCLGCHGVGNKLSGLDLRAREGALKGGVKGTALVPGSSGRSLLFKMVTGERRPQMPPAIKLPAAEVALLRRWIDAGAPWPGTITSAAKQTWWSFKVPVKPPVPTLAAPQTAPASPIDRFLLARLRGQGLAFSPEASRQALIRRAYLDLIGLPPTPDEVRDFVNDRSSNAWEKVVDRLLASPRYGERWGRHWLDAVRYADSGGFEGDRDRAYAWRYRDYVIEAFNQDLPFDRFLKEQIAGDEIAPGDNRALIATGYLAVGPKEIVMENERNRADQLDDLVSTTGQAMLGLTLNCARCHDHKYDPVTTRDYYRLSACFAPSQRREVEVFSPEERRQALALDEQVKPLRARLDSLRRRVKPEAALKTVPDADDPQVTAALPEPDRKAFTEGLAALKALEARRGAMPRAEVVTDSAADWPDAHILIRGDAGTPGAVVKPGFIEYLPGGDADIARASPVPGSTGRRKALAEWIASRANPLTARVFMNRVWRQHFGRGLVNTPSNFGLSGELPSHPELLDWLACMFMEGGWRLKPMHKLMLMSQAWRQGSRVRPEAAAVDPDNRLVWRMPERRLEAEAIRDSILYLAGSLNLQMGGPPIYPPIDPTLRADTFQGPNWHDGDDGPTTWRRSVYVKVKRSLLLPQLEEFYCPQITTTLAARNITTTPIQALALLNDPLILRQARLFAQRVTALAGKDPKQQITRAYEMALGRSPSTRQMALALEYLGSRARSGRPDPLADVCHALINSNEFVYSP